MRETVTSDRLKSMHEERAQLKDCDECRTRGNNLRNWCCEYGIWGAGATSTASLREPWSLGIRDDDAANPGTRHGPLDQIGRLLLAKYLGALLSVKYWTTLAAWI